MKESLSESVYDQTMKERFATIEKHLFWNGGVKREILRSELGLSESTANLTFRAYNKARPGVLIRGGRAGYVAPADFEPEYYTPTIDDCPLPQIVASVEHPEPKAEILKTLSQAIRENRYVIFDYLDAEGNTSRRKVQPLAIVKSAAFPNLLHGWCALRQGSRNFDFSFMSNVELGEEVEQQRQIEEVRIHIPVPEESADQYGKEIALKIPEACKLQTLLSVASNPHLSKELSKKIMQLIDESYKENQ